MNVLSLFDGMACGMLAMQKVGINVTRYVAYEIDKYAVQTSSHNFPMIEHRGDVFQADFTEFRGFDFLVGGSPCTYWSIAQKNNRETEASGMGWELFSQYVRALHESQPKWFVYENNKSMSKAIRTSIDEAFGFEAVCINSALVSAQNRQRLYWVGKRNEDGTYSKVHVEQPEDLGLLLKDVLDSAYAWQDKAFCVTATEYKGSNPRQTLTKHRRTMVAEPVPHPVPVDCPALRVREATAKGYVDIEPGDCVDMTMPNSKTRRGRSMKDKCNCVMTGCQYYQYCGTLSKPIYEVKDGMIAINDKQYPIKLVDGYYILRKLSVIECMRLQTVPMWFQWTVSDTQAYKMLGNGWTVDVIAHILNSLVGE